MRFFIFLFLSGNALAAPAEFDSSKKLILLPIAYYTPETKLAGGLLFIKNLWKEKEGHTSNLLGTVSFTANSQILISLSPKLFFNQGDWDLSGHFFYSHYPNRFYGRGVANSLSSPEPYVENNFLMGLGFGKNILADLYLRLGAAQDQRKISEYEEGGLIQGEIQSLVQNLEVYSVSGALEWDQRDYPQAPRQGAWYRWTQHYYTPRDRDGVKDLPTFRKWDVDLRQYVLLAPAWIGALQVFISEVEGEDIPFQYLNSVGGGARMRGYYSGQYRDRALALAQLEVRQEWNEKWVASIFAGAARLGAGVQRLESEGHFYSGGFGAHYILDPENRTKLRLDLGFTGKETGVYFLVGEAF